MLILPGYVTRLVGGSHPFEGRVEVEVGGVWGTVCDAGWDTEDAMVVCRSLLGANWTGAAQPMYDAHYGQGTGDILLSDVDCDGHQMNLEECDLLLDQYYSGHSYDDNYVFYHGYNLYVCEHSEDAGVSCVNITGTYIINITLHDKAYILLYWRLTPRVILMYQTASVCFP